MGMARASTLRRERDRCALVTRSARTKTSPAAIPAPAVAGPVSRARKRIGSAKAAEAQNRLIALVERGIAAVVVDALTGIGRAPASAGPRRLAPLRARPALGVSLGKQQSHYCDTEQNKTDRAHGFFLPVHPFVRRRRYGHTERTPQRPLRSLRAKILGDR